MFWYLISELRTRIYIINFYFTWKLYLYFEIVTDGKMDNWKKFWASVNTKSQKKSNYICVQKYSVSEIIITKNSFNLLKIRAPIF